MANNNVGKTIKFYSSKTATEALNMASSEPGSLFFTESGIILN